MRDYKPDLVHVLLKSVVSTTLTADGVPIACGGLFLFWPGVGELWFHATAEAPRHKVAVIRTARRLVSEWAEKFSLHRIQLTIDESFSASYRLAEALGFVRESRMPKYGPGRENFLRYVYFPGESV